MSSSVDSATRNSNISSERGSDARSLAARIITRTWNEASFASLALDAELSLDPRIDGRERALATEFVYGVLRTQSALEALLAKHARRGRITLADEGRAQLLIAAYSLCFLDRIPPFAAVSEAVNRIRASDGRERAAFANALLRAVARDVGRHKPRLEAFVATSAPAWVRGALRKSLGRAGAQAFLEAGPIPPPIGLCIADASTRDMWMARLRLAAPEAQIEPGQLSPHSILLRGAGDVRHLPGFNDSWIIQEEGAQVVTLALGAKPAERILDACAGHGNKSWLLGHIVQPGGHVDVADRYPAKLRALSEGAAGKLVRRAYQVDWTQDSPAVEQLYDRILVDAPCSGIGTIRRRPDLLLRRKPEDVLELAALQLAILHRVLPLVKRGGTIIYAVCSVLREEGEDVIEQACTQSLAMTGRRLSLAHFETKMLRELSNGSCVLRVLPQTHRVDGFFIASLTVDEDSDPDPERTPTPA